LEAKRGVCLGDRCVLDHDAVAQASARDSMIETGNEKTVTVTMIMKHLRDCKRRAPNLETLQFFL